MKVATLVFVINATCVSPSSQHVGSTEIYKIPCAGLRYEEIVGNPFKEAQEANAPLAGPALAEKKAKPAQRTRYEHGKVKKKKRCKRRRCR